MSTATIMDLTIVVNSFRRIGFDIRASPDSPFLKYPLRFIMPAIGTIIWTLAVFNYTFTYFSDLEKVVPALSIFTQLLLSEAKAVVFMARGRQFISLIQNFEDLAMQADSAEREVWNTESMRILSLIRPYSIACWTTVIISVLIPLLKLLITYIIYDEIVITLPVPGIFPYDHTQTFYLIFTNMCSVCLVYFSINAIVGVEGLFGWYVCNVTAHFRILRLKVARVFDEVNNLSATHFTRNLAQIIEYHSRIMIMASEFDVLFAQIVFVQVFLSCLQLCCLAFQFAFSTDGTIYLNTSMLLASLMLQLMIYCFGGEKVKNENDAMCDSIYLLTPWHKLPPKMQKSFAMSLICTQRPMTLSGYFFTADRELLVWIFKTAGSFTALLFGLKEKQKTFDATAEPHLL